MDDKVYTIYAIQCKTNKKIYIGATVQNLKNRLQTHLAFLRHNKHSNKLLQEDFNKYGEEKFEFYELETGITYQDKNKEKFYMEKYETYKEEKGYNKEDRYFKRNKEIKIIKGHPEIQI